MNVTHVLSHKLKMQRRRLEYLLSQHVRESDEDKCPEVFLEELIQRWAKANNKVVSISIVRERR